MYILIMDYLPTLTASKVLIRVCAFYNWIVRLRMRVCLRVWGCACVQACVLAGGMISVSATVHVCVAVEMRVFILRLQASVCLCVHHRQNTKWQRQWLVYEMKGWHRYLQWSK